MVKDKITLNVLADISRKIGSTTVITPKSASRTELNERALVIFNGSNIGIDEKLKEIKMLKDKGVSISIAFSFMGDKIVNENGIIDYLKPDQIYKEEDILQLKSIANRYSYVIAPTLTINTMSKVTKGFIDSFLSNIVWTFLYMGKKVYIDFTSALNYLGEQCANPAIEKVINDQISAIKDIGAIEIKTGNYLNTILKDNQEKKYTNNLNSRLSSSLNSSLNMTFNKKINTNIPSSTEKKKDGKKILTGTDIAQLAKSNNSITLPKGSIITPLAKDKIRELGISVKFE